MMGHLTEVKYITRHMLRSSPDTLFVFGDNMKRRGFGGQAREMRGEPNAVGIPTKWYPSNRPDAFFQDHDFDEVKRAIDLAFDQLRLHVKTGGDVVWPADGIGTGLANLKSHAPKIWNYLEKRRSLLYTMRRSSQS